MATGYNRVYNTVLSGNEAQSSLSGDDLRMLEFDAALKRRQSVVLAVSPGTTLSVEQWMQASIDSLLVSGSAGGAADVMINLGTNSATQAAAYVALFDLRSTNQERLLRLSLLQPSGAGHKLLLQNSTGGSNRVGVSVNNGAVGASQTLFDADIAPGPTAVGPPATGPLAGNLAGLERVVVVSATNLVSGSEAVKFQILSGSL